MKRMKVYRKNKEEGSGEVKRGKGERSRAIDGKKIIEEKGKILQDRWK